MKTENQIPDNLGPYAIVKDGAAPNVLGKGEWGAVYKAFNSKLRCFAALRIIPLGAFPTEEAKQKFSADVRVATYIMGDRRLASVFPLELTDNAYLYGSELCSGEKLIDRISRDGSLPAEAAVKAAKQLAEALDTVGKTGLQHQRITARNIMLDEGEDENDVRLKVLDLALPRANSLESSAAAECDFRSPEEKVAGSAADARSAIYTVGAVLYYMLVGSEKFQALRPKSSANQENWPEDSANLSAGCLAVLEKTLCHDPALRLQTLPELCDLLEKVIDSPESFEAAKRELAQRRAQEEEDAKRRLQEEAEAARRAKEEAEAARRAQEESARRRAQEEEEARRRAQEEEAAQMRAKEEEAKRRVQREAEAARRAKEDEEATQRAQEESARRRAQEGEEAQRRAQEEEAARKRTQEQEAQRKAQKEGARRAAEKQRLAELQAEEKRRKAEQKSKPKEIVTRETGKNPDAGGIPWGWVAGVVILVVGGLAGIYFWFANPSQPKAASQAVNPPAPVAANPPATPQPTQPSQPTPPPTPPAPVPVPPPPVPVTSGELVINTDPSCAHVTLDGRPPQTAPYAFSNVPFGKHHFIVERDGYKRRELDLSFDGSPLAPIQLQPLPDPFQPLVDRIKAAPHDSPDSLRASLDYLQQVKTQPPSRQLSPAQAQQDLSSALLDLEKKMISVPQYHHKEVYKDLLGNKVLADAKAMDSVPTISVPATVMLADNEFGVDDAKALELFKSAADKNDRYAMRMLGKLYEQTQDFEKSKDWINKASAAGDSYAHVLQLYSTLRDKNNADPTAKPAALKELESEVADWEKALANGDSSVDLPTLGRAELLLGNYDYECYQTSQKRAGDDQTDPKDYRQMAAGLYGKATDHGEPLGFYELGKMALDAHDLNEAKVQFEKGAGESPACSKALAKLNQ